MVVVSMAVDMTTLRFASGCRCEILILVVDGKDVAEIRHDGELLYPLDPRHPIFRGLQREAASSWMRRNKEAKNP
jgi:hypothetical protein